MQSEQTKTMPNILVVDDSVATLEMLDDALSSEAMKVEVASSGRNAIAAVSEVKPDLILMDALMPGLDGFETCKILKTEKHCEDVPIVFMTGSDDASHVVEALSSGGVDFVSKPILLDQLFARMRVHLANARRVQSARNALDLTGRKFVACDNNGVILWTTPQAADLLKKAGLHEEEGAKLPWEIVDSLFSGDSTNSNSKGKSSYSFVSANIEVEFTLFDDSNLDENLIQLTNADRGSYEQQLAAAFELTARESEVLLWITYGKSNKEIAEILDMSPRTVNKHLEQIFIKLSVENRTSAATKSVRVLWNES